MPLRQAILTQAPWGPTAALLDRGAVAELRIESLPESLGAVHTGRILRSQRGLGRFIDIGGGVVGLASGRGPPEGTMATVQVTRAPHGDKGPALALAPKLAGRLVVLCPTRPGIAASKGIVDPAIRRHLQGFAKRLAGDGEGLIMRDAAALAGDTAIERELGALRERWRQITGAAGKAPGRLWHERDPLLPFLRDGLAAGGMLTADRTLMRRAERLGFADVEIRMSTEPGYEAYGLRDVIARALEPEVALPGGGRMTVEATRAATVIDVDGGGGRSQRTANMEAADRLGRELRLRGIGGLILIDFIDPDRPEERREIGHRLERGFAGDRSERRMLAMSPLGVIEMTRRRLGPPLADQWAATGKEYP